MKRALFAGTFDPPTNGHLDIISRAAKLCDQLYVGVATNPSKKQLWTWEKRQQVLQEITTEISNVTVVAFDGLVVDFAKKNQIDILIRGLRSFSDYDYERQMAFANRKLGGVETLFLMADEAHAAICSSLIREIAHFGGSVEAFVPKQVRIAKL